MGKVDILRKKYPRFIYKGYSWKFFGKNLNISFDFRIPPDIKFKPTIVIKNIDKKRMKRVGDSILNNFVFNLGMIELLSYWKATCSPEIVVEAGYLNQEQINWWKDLINRGMGQFFYENKIDFTKSNFLKINSLQRTVLCKSWQKGLKNRVLVPIGGGKDSVVTLELLKKDKNNIICFTGEKQRKIIEISGCKNSIIIEREIDKKLLELNRKGFLNGHTPFSAYLAFLSGLLAVVLDTKYIAFSNERSSNEGNLKYLPRTETKSLVRGLGKPCTRTPKENKFPTGQTSSVRGLAINHQYSKSFDFEQKFRKYSKKYLAKDLEYFSFLRPLYEIQIAKLFSRYPKYFDTFLSCNEAFKTYSGIKKPSGKWCRKCPKCLFVFMILYPFIKKDKLVKIFGQNLFVKKELLSLMLELIGERKFKPFECVGTKKESLIAFYLSLKKNRERVSVGLPYLLKYFENSVLPKHPNLDKESKKMMNSWDKKNNLNSDFKRILKINSF